MAENIVTPALPPGSLPVIRAGAAGTLYTTPAGRQLHITHVFLSAAQGAAGVAATANVNLQLTNILGNTTQNWPFLYVGPTQGSIAFMTLDNLDLVLPAGNSIVVAAGVGMTGQVVGGFAGWEESVPS